MSYSGWRYATASVIGTSHEKLGGQCQDANDCHVYVLPSGETILMATVADGAGTAPRGGEGAGVACQVFASLVNDHVSGGNTVEQISRQTADFWLGVIQSALDRRAESELRQRRDFACTLLGLVAGTSCAACLQVGDGAIVVSDSEEHTYSHVFWPDRGEYANMTHFVTQEEAKDHLQFELIRRQIIEVALLSDGLQGVALNYQQQVAHEPFFRGLFAPLRRAAEGRSDDLSGALTTFLSSTRVTEKTDDDKTLVLASRISGSLELSLST